MQFFLPSLAPIKPCSCCSHSTAATWHLHVSPEGWKAPLFPALTSVHTRTCQVVWYQIQLYWQPQVCSFQPGLAQHLAVIHYCFGSGIDAMLPNSKDRGKYCAFSLLFFAASGSLTYTFPGSWASWSRTTWFILVLSLLLILTLKRWIAKWLWGVA